MDLIKSITQEYERTDIPEFAVGDTVKVFLKVREGNKERIQVFEGFVLKRQNGGISESFGEVFAETEPFGDALKETFHKK